MGALRRKAAILPRARIVQASHASATTYARDRPMPLARDAAIARIHAAMLRRHLDYRVPHALTFRFFARS
jgi:hypothetical protein